MISSLKITVLVENTAGRRGLLGEHGLSFLIEADNSRILFDTGQGMTLIHNGDILGVSLNNLDAIAFLWHELKSIDCRDCRVGTIFEIESIGK
ncbi:hypothetical protein [Cyanobacterium sp. Dongsha4]|uniref:hypothetical protein n=1 Tax=Cyanobacterium sp. DS4 TaxID=2878255 RepID=UPI002E816ABB|nr:hypothetical protein [Cyanobacterium sp. Dongsha4]WVL00392.1 hypothetical protein Dongsha4_17365 [Cyanobacterium sp. Dongsha4]